MSSTNTISPLRQRMIDDMNLRNLARRTQEAYIRGAFLRRSPETAFRRSIHPQQPRAHFPEKRFAKAQHRRPSGGHAIIP